MALTGLMTIVAGGLTAGSGLEINANLKSAIETFNTENISGSVQNLLAQNTNDDIKEVLNLAPDFMTGLAPDGIDLGSVSNVPQAVLDQANLVFPDIPTFISVYTKAVNHATQIFSFKGALAQAQNTKIEDLGFQYKNYSDIASGGVTSQFKKEGIPNLAKEFANLGSLFSVKSLSSMTDIALVSKNLLEQGLGYAGNLENQISQSGINLDDASEEDREVLLNIFKKISGTDLNEIIEVTEFKPANRDSIKSLADIFDIEKVFTKDARAALEPNDSFDDLARKLGNVGGNFADSAALSAFYSNLNLKSFDSLNSLDTLLPSSVAASLNNVGGQGSGFFGNPTVVDLIGSVSGIGYTDDIEFVNETQAKLLTMDTDIAAFKAYVDDVANVTAANLSARISSFNAKSELQRTFQEAERKYRSTAERLKLEKSNIVEAKLLENVVPASSTEIMSFAGQLHTYSLDNMKLKTAELLKAVISPDSSGESIEACLNEGKNKAEMAKIGLDPGTGLDAMAYAKKISQ